MDKLMVNNDFHTGKRLNKARKLRALRLKDIAAHFNVQEDTILKWQNRGVPKKFLPALAHYFGVDEWVFSNEGIHEKEFQGIILDPNKLGAMRPVFSFQGNWEQKDGLIHTNSFDIKTHKLLIRAFVWGVEGQTISQFTLNRPGIYEMKTTERQSFPKPPTLRLITDKNTKISERVMGEMIIEHLNPQAYYFTVHTPKQYELFVFELEQYTV
jgi:transcriptional regulator with XRE-family HTH domain